MNNRPKECYYNSQDYAHALKRVMTMSYSQLYARMDKMCVPKKVCAFYDALLSQNINKSIRTELERRFSYLTPMNVVHTLTRGNRSYAFQADEKDAHKMWVTEENGDKYPVSVPDSRVLWKRLVTESYVVSS